MELLWIPNSDEYGSIETKGAFESEVKVLQTQTDTLM